MLDTVTHNYNIVVAHGSWIGDWSLYSDWSLQYNIFEKAATPFNVCCMLEKTFYRNQNILPAKNVGSKQVIKHACYML